jgi:choice-of-anchor A domain-containing protein
MRNRGLLFLTVALAASPLVCKADPFGADPFGVASGYNLVALGTVNSSGKLVGGTINDQSEAQGRVAAAGEILNIGTVGSSLNGSPGSDPYKGAATFSVNSNTFTFDVVAEGGIKSGLNITLNSQGSVFADSPNTGVNYNFNGNNNVRGTLVTGNGSNNPINFNALRGSLEAQSLLLGGLATTGTIVGSGHSGYGNPSFFVLLGTSTTLNVFNITADELADANHPIDIVAPPGSTIIVNVDGTDVSLGTTIYYNGQEHTDSDTTSDILFNFPDATSVNLNGELTASVLAPFATLGGNGDIDGTVIAATIGDIGEAHNIEFDGTLPTPPPTNQSAPPVPEPGTLMLVGSGILSVAGAVRRRKKVSALS